MGYLSQKKKQNNARELLNISLSVLAVCCVILLGWRDSEVAAVIGHRLFQIYVYALIIMVYALVSRFYSHALGVFAVAFVLFLNIGMGGNLFFSQKTGGLQTLNVLYQGDAENLYDIERQMLRNKVDVAGLNRRKSRLFNGGSDEYNRSASPENLNMILTPHRIFRSGEVLVSAHNRVGFAEIAAGYERLIFLTLDFSETPRSELSSALKNLAEFINMQDLPVIVAGDFGIEAWSPVFLTFMEKTGLEVKNRIILSDGKRLFNPFRMPSLNILACKNVGIKKLSFLNAKHNLRRPLLIELNY